jgi:hypothetical protein
MYYFLKYVFYTLVYKYIRGTTYYYTLLVIALFIGNVVCLINNYIKIL